VAIPQPLPTSGLDLGKDRARSRFRCGNLHADFADVGGRLLPSIEEWGNVEVALGFFGSPGSEVEIMGNWNPNFAFDLCGFRSVSDGDHDSGLFLLFSSYLPLL